MIRNLSIATAILAGLASAQGTGNPIGYPETANDTSSGNLVPLGFLGGSTNFDEGRSQIRIPATFLPGIATVVSELESICQNTATVVYQQLDITMSLIPPSQPTSTTFAANLVSPVPVFSATNLSVNWASNTFQGFVLQTPFPYDGQSDIIIDIQKIVDRSQTTAGIATFLTTGNPGRQDLPTMQYEFGPGTSTAPNARIVTRTQKFRPRFVAVPTLELDSFRTTQASRDIFAIGEPFDWTLYGDAGDLYGTLLSLQRNPTPGRFLRFQGVLQLDLPLTIGLTSGAIPGSGSVTGSVTIPADPNAVGLTPVVQGVVIGGTIRGFTNAPDFVINSDV